MKLKGWKSVFAACLALAGVMSPIGSVAHAQSVTPEDARKIATEAVVYGFPLVDNYRVLYSYFVDQKGSEFKAPWNQINNVDRVFTPDDKTIQTPNSDTPYSQLGADLRAEPLVLTVPAVEKDRYYSLQFIDLYTFNFAYVGSRATGNEAGNFLLAGPGWKGETPPGIKQVIHSETELAFVLYRTQLKGPDDIEEVKKVQAGFKVQPLSAFLGKPAPPAAAAIDFFKPLGPAEQRASMRFFDELNFILQFAPTHASEVELRKKFEQIGVVPGRAFDAGKLSPDLQSAIAEGQSQAWLDLADFKAKVVDTGIRTSADGFGTREFLKNDYMARMASAAYGIYGNSKEEAMYPAYFVDSDGKALDGKNGKYTLRFGPDELPPVNSFWSLTMYELPASLLVPNAINRYLINSSMLPDLKRDPDGGITLYLQHERPSKDKEANWLPAPEGPFWTTLRLYWPKSEALDGTWKQPPLQHVSANSGEDTEPKVPVTVENFARAESDLYFAGVVKNGGFGKFDHTREVAPLDKQTVIRLNRDTVYSSAVFDLDAGPISITLPDAGKRFMSLQIINEDHYTYGVFYKAGTYTFTRKDMGTRYFVAAVRTLIDPNSDKDIAEVHKLQDAIKIKQKAVGTFDVPNWDMVSQAKIRNALNTLADTLPDKNQMFGKKGEVDPVRFLLGAASGWGGNPDKDAIYLNIFPKQNDGKTVYKLMAKDVPVNSFWSVSVYNAEGYYQANEQNAYTLNNITAKKGKDGSTTIQFGGCDGKVENCLPTMDGWNYMVRLYRPKAEILSGKWTFPEAEPVN
ncbi:DUF1254 domain-containing protein (plasmid) [Agrobacterium sp. CGMCC 11546]|nr:DUF1254 domain-containing protein [Agrobacterium sp. CGMCC 11546]